MTMRIALVMTILLAVSTDELTAQRRYPRVPGSTGRYYGPTQAAAQYRRRYGREWPGHRPLTTRRTVNRNVTVVLPFAYPFAPTFGGPFAPIQYYTPPVVLNGGPWATPYAPWATPYYSSWGYSSLFDSWQAPFPLQPAFGGLGGFGGFGYQQQFQSTQTNINLAAPASGLPNGPVTVAKPAPKSAPVGAPEVEPNPVHVKVAEPGDRVAAIRFQAQGDLLFRTRNYNKAFTAYKAAMDADQSRPEPYYRLAVLFTAMQRYEPAIRYLKQGIDFAPEFARSGDRLDDIYGSVRVVMKEEHLHSLQQWAREDDASPDRQLLTGAMLVFDNRHDEAAAHLERASELSRRPSRAIALLSARNVTERPESTESLILTPDPGPVSTADVGAADGDIPPAPKLPPLPPTPSTSKPSVLPDK